MINISRKINAFLKPENGNTVIFYFIIVDVLVRGTDRIFETRSVGDCHVIYSTFEPAHVKRVLITQANSEGSGEPAHPCSHASTFAVHTQ